MSEQKRACGYRKVNGIYLVSGGFSLDCKQLPYILEVCPCCSAGIKQARGWTWIQPSMMFPKANDCTCLAFGNLEICPFKRDTKEGLLWVGEKFYNPQSFIEEANKMGVSKRISKVPRDFQLGKTWVFLAHPKAGFKESHSVPAVFYAFKPTRIEKIVTEKDFKNTEKMNGLRKQGLTPVPVEDIEQHHGSVYDKPKNKTTQSKINDRFEEI